tara:strand:- start:301 stop:570 length:270 start_codon:yes stop_codon:yes gene_type:complete
MYSSFYFSHEDPINHSHNFFNNEMKRFSHSSISVGCADENINIMSIRSEWPISRKKNLYLVTEFGFGLGLIHMGIKYEPNYNETGFSYI